MALEAWIHQAHLHSEDCLFPSRLHASMHLSTRQYARIVKAWIKAISLDYVRHRHDETYEGIADLSQDKEPESSSALLGHTKLESTVRYLGIEVDDALEMAEQTEV